MSLYIETHKELNEKFPDFYKTIVVNANRNSICGDCYDNVGENISYKNEFYCELTALYAIWKNMKNDEIVGINHYRRFFLLEGKLIEKSEVVRILEDYDVIVPQKVTFIRNVATQYWSTCGYKKDLNFLSDVLEKVEPEYVTAYKKVLKSHNLYLYNMIIMKQELFDDYCEWLFTILFTLEKFIDPSKRKGYYKRVFGFISERLLNVYIKKNNLKIYELPILFTGKKMPIRNRIINKAQKFVEKSF